MTTSPFLDAAGTVAHLLDGITDPQWAAFGLGAWDVRGLVGHTSRSIVTVVEYLDRPVPAEQLPSAEAYLAAVGGTDHARVIDRGVQAGAALGELPAQTWRSLTEQAAAKLERQDLDAVIHTALGGMRVRHYLPTRTFELVVHGFDIAHATHQDVRFTDGALREAAELAARTAVLNGQGRQMLFALTGRPEAGFSIV